MKNGQFKQVESLASESKEGFGSQGARVASEGENEGNGFFLSSPRKDHTSLSGVVRSVLDFQARKEGLQIPAMLLSLL